MADSTPQSGKSDPHDPVEELLEHAFDPLLRGFRNQIAERARVDFPSLGVGLSEPLVFALIAHGHHGIDAVGLAIYVVVDPAQLEFQLFGREGERAEHSHART